MLTLYMLGGWDHNAGLLAKLGKHSLGKGCLYIKRLEDVKMPVLKRLIAESLKRAKKLHKRRLGNRLSRHSGEIRLTAFAVMPRTEPGRLVRGSRHTAKKMAVRKVRQGGFLFFYRSALSKQSQVPAIAGCVRG